MEYAIIAINGKQYKVKKGDIIEMERLSGKPGEKISFDNILLVASGDNVLIGTPNVQGASVKATVSEHIKGEKVRVSKFKAKVRYRRVTGKRQSLTKLTIDEIIAKNISKKEVKEPTKAKVKKQI